MSSPTTPWPRIPLVGDYGRPARATWRGVDWAGYEHDLAVAGSRLHYLDHTAGHHQGEDVFVLAHGLGGRWQHWSENIPALGQRGRVIAVDLPGFGRFRPLPGRYSINTFAELCRQLRLAPGGVPRATHLAGRWRCGSPPGTPTWRGRSRDVKLGVHQHIPRPHCTPGRADRGQLAHHSPTP